MISKDYDLILKESVDNFIEEETLKSKKCKNCTCNINFRNREITKEYEIDDNIAFYLSYVGGYVKLLENRYIRCPHCKYMNFLEKEIIDNQFCHGLEIDKIKEEWKEKYNIK